MESIEKLYKLNEKINKLYNSFCSSITIKENKAYEFSLNDYKFELYNNDVILCKTPDVDYVILPSIITKIKSTAFMESTGYKKIINLSYVEDMSCLFANSKITYLDLSCFSTVFVKNMRGMFLGCSLLTYVDLSNINTYNVDSMECMFYNCESLKSIDLSSFWFKYNVNMNKMFYNCKNLTHLNINNYKDNYVENNCEDIFRGCRSLYNLKTSSQTIYNILIKEKSRIYQLCKYLLSNNKISINSIFNILVKGYI